MTIKSCSNINKIKSSFNQKLYLKTIRLKTFKTGAKLLRVRPDGWPELFGVISRFFAWHSRKRICFWMQLVRNSLNMYFSNSKFALKLEMQSTEFSYSFLPRVFFSLTGRLKSKLSMPFPPGCGCRLKLASKTANLLRLLQFASLLNV